MQERINTANCGARLTAMAVFELTSAATRAKLIPPAPAHSCCKIRLFVRQHRHNIRGSLPALEQLCHNPHWTVDVREECFVALAEVIKPQVTVWCPEHAILWAAAVADETHIARAAICW